jgi:hypothetical protein
MRVAAARFSLSSLVAAMTLASSTLVTAAASPAPEDQFPTIQAWLDTEQFGPPDAPAGGMIQVGITVWDTHQHELTPIEGLEVRLKPAKGKAPSSVATVTWDWPGHAVADLTVPPGGPGKIELGVHILACSAPGDCVDTVLPLDIAGSGPPPDAPLAELLVARFHPIVGDVVAGRTFPVAVDMIARGFYDYDALPLANGIVVRASNGAGDKLASDTLVQQRAAGTPFQGHLTIAETGDVVLAAALPGTNGGPDQPIADATLDVTVIEGGRRESASPAPAAPAAPSESPADSQGGIPLVAWVVGIGALVVGGGLVLRRVLADL